MGVYESNNLKFYDMCTKFNYIPSESINEQDDFGRSIDIKTV
jgi:hypothetical protein